VRLQRTTVALGVLAALFGTTHLLNPAWGDLYAEQLPMPGVLVATFADRNAAALFLGCCLLLLAGLPSFPRGAAGRIAAVGAAGFLAVCVLLTQSRSGIVLLGAPLALISWRILASARHPPQAKRDHRARLTAIAALAAAAIAVAAIVSSGQVQTSLARFEQGDEMRAEMREDARFAAARYWPVGAGMGTFDEVFQIDESLEYVSPRRAGRAHMDYLELAIEAGAIGLALAALWLVWVAWAGWRAVRRRDAWSARAGALIIAGIAAQSLLSFPLRNQAMLCAAALAVVLLARSPAATSPDVRR
jgi:O-antigen ligase